METRFDKIMENMEREMQELRKINQRLRARNALIKHSYRKLSDLKELTIREMNGWSTVGPKIIAIIYLVMEHYQIFMEIPDKHTRESKQLANYIETLRKKIIFHSL